MGHATRSRTLVRSEGGSFADEVRGRMIGLLRVVTCSLVILLWVPATLIAGEVSLNEAVAVAVEKNPDLAVVANELVVVRGELQRANYIIPP
jgi:hypothetical protein